MKVNSRSELSFVDDVLAMLEKFDAEHDYTDSYVVGKLVVHDGDNGVIGTVQWDDAWVVR